MFSYFSAPTSLHHSLPCICDCGGDWLQSRLLTPARKSADSVEDDEDATWNTSHITWLLITGEQGPHKVIQITRRTRCRGRLPRSLKVQGTAISARLRALIQSERKKFEASSARAFNHRSSGDESAVITMKTTCHASRGTLIKSKWPRLSKSRNDYTRPCSNQPP